MKLTSPLYKEQMKKTFRNTSHARIIFQQVDPTARGDGAFSDNGHAVYSEWGSVDTGHRPKETYATLEHNFWILDGTKPILPDSPPYHQEGFVGDEISDENREYATHPFITREFEENHSIIGLTLTFDDVNESAPEHIIIRFYHNDVQVDVVELDSISSSTIVIERPIPLLDKFTVEILKTRLPYRRTRIQRLLYGVEKLFENVDIDSAETTTDVDPIGRRQPTETFTFTIFDFERQYNPDNPDGVWEYIDIQAPVIIQFGYKLDNGVIEWLDPDNYLLDGRPEIKDNSATFKATRLAGHMTDTYYRGELGSKSLYELAESVLLDAELPVTASLGNPWHIDPALQDIYTTAPLPIDTHKNCLQLIAHAGMCKFYTDSEGTVRLERLEIPEAPEDFTLDFDSALAEPTISKIEPLYSVNVLKYAYGMADSATELHKSTFTVSGSTEFYAEFSMAGEVAVNITGGTLSNVKIYAHVVTATITASGEVTVTITGKQITQSTSGIPYVVSVDNRGEMETIENPLVTEDSHKTMLEQHIAGYLALRNAYTIDYRGNPELEAGDFINLQSQFTPTFPALVLKHVISFNGGALEGQGIFKKVGGD